MPCRYSRSYFGRKSQCSTKHLSRRKYTDLVDLEDRWRQLGSSLAPRKPPHLEVLRKLIQLGLRMRLLRATRLH